MCRPLRLARSPDSTVTRPPMPRQCERGRHSRQPHCNGSAPGGRKHNPVRFTGVPAMDVVTPRHIDAYLRLLSCTAEGCEGAAGCHGFRNVVLDVRAGWRLDVGCDFGGRSARCGRVTVTRPPAIVNVTDRRALGGISSFGNAEVGVRRNRCSYQGVLVVVIGPGVASASRGCGE